MCGGEPQMAPHKLRRRGGGGGNQSSPHDRKEVTEFEPIWLAVSFDRPDTADVSFGHAQCEGQLSHQGNMETGDWKGGFD